MIKLGRVVMAGAVLVSPASAQQKPLEEDAVSQAEAERLAELAYIAQDLGVPVPLNQGTGRGLFDEQPGDYPPQLWIEGKQGKVEIAVLVDRTGQPTACRIRESSGHKALDERTCELTLKRARFQPALDSNGEPVEAEYWGGYTWRIRKPQISRSFTVSIAYTLTPEGEVVDCEVIEATGELTKGQRERLENQPCPASSFLEGRVYRDENGVPVAKRITISNAIAVTDPTTTTDQP